MRKLLLNYLRPIDGYYLPEVYFNPRRRVKMIAETKIRNKGYRNLAYWLNAFITNVNQTILETGGTARATGSANDVEPLYNVWKPFYRLFLGLNIGSSTSPHDVSRYELYSRHFSRGPQGLDWLDELATETRWQSFFRWSFPPPDKAVGEVGFYLAPRGSLFLLARAIIDPPINKSGDTLYEEGWRITYPANYTRWFIRAYYQSFSETSSEVGIPVYDTGGVLRHIRFNAPFAGSTDIMIGRDNTSPSPTHYALQNPIGSLSSQSHSVEIDTTLQECRIVRIGTYTPSVNETLGEVGLFCNVYDTTGTARKIMIARGIWDPTVTLVAGTTYTIGIVLRLG
jgi:hypothetical protein